MGHPHLRPSRSNEETIALVSVTHCSGTMALVEYNHQSINDAASNRVWVADFTSSISKEVKVTSNLATELKVFTPVRLVM